MKGIILAGGNGTRLQPLTLIQNKHLLPIYNKPMILYPLETLKSLEIKDILIVSGGEYIGGFTEFLGDGSRFGVNITYRVQEKAGGIAEALGLGKDFSRGESVAVILGDNIFGIDNIIERLGVCMNNKPWLEFGGIPEDKATLVVKKMKGASRFGVLVGGDFVDKSPNHFKIIEKPKDIEEGDVVTGLYIYPYEVFNVIPTLKPSHRGELEITDVNNYFLVDKHMARICHLNESDFWSDAGTFDSLLASANWAQQNK